jgi:hypothetical protein
VALEALKAAGSAWGDKRAGARLKAQFLASRPFGYPFFAIQIKVF